MREELGAEIDQTIWSCGSLIDRAQGLLADHAILQYLDGLLQPAYCATGTVVDGSVEHQESERSRQAIAGDPLPIVSLVERLRRIEM